MSKASDILTKPKVTVSDILENKTVNEANMMDSRIVTGVTDTVARYRSTQKLEYRLNLILTAAVYAAAAGVKDDADKGRLISAANSINREFGNLKEISDIDTLLTTICNQTR